jgi:tRNA G18 (ribose-2'-O)-methylase SpoU
MRGYFGIGVWHAKTANNIGTLWRSAHNFGAAFIFTIGKRFPRQASDTTDARRHVPLYEYSDLDDLLAHLPFSCPLVGIEQAPWAKALPEFTHPERACYLLGAEDHGLSPEVMRRCHLIVEVPGATHCLNVATAGSIVLYDRLNKQTRAA